MYVCGCSCVAVAAYVLWLCVLRDCTYRTRVQPCASWLLACVNVCFVTVCGCMDVCEWKVVTVAVVAGVACSCVLVCVAVCGCGRMHAEACACPSMCVSLFLHLCLAAYPPLTASLPLCLAAFLCISASLCVSLCLSLCLSLAPYASLYASQPRCVVSLPLC